MRKYLLGFAVFVLAFGVFLVSVHYSCKSRVFAASPNTPKPIALNQASAIDYSMPFPGSILPNNPLWTLKAARDWVWYYITLDPLKKAELALLFSDKRLMASKALFEVKKPDIAVSTLTKGEKYLEIASKQLEIAHAKGETISDFTIKLTTSSLKHRQIIEQEILPLAPEDAKPEIIKVESYAKDTYKSSKSLLDSKGIAGPKDPFDGQ